jgi:KaiC/GvpD/RAD55 family RecA-like ATPase
MGPMDQIFSQLPDTTKNRLLAQLTLWRNTPGDGLFETAEQFNAAEEPPLTFLIDGLLARNQLVMLGGRAKSGKSWLVAQLAQSLDTGQPFLGRAVERAKVLYLPLEDKRARLKRRTKMLGWKPQTTMFNYRIGRFNGPTDGFGPGLELIERVAFDFDVIIIDTLIATLDGTISENDNTSMGAIVNELSAIAHALSCTIVLVHHIGKGMSDDVFNLLRGASALRGAYDVGMMLERRQGEREAVLHIEARDFETPGLTIRQREDGSGWELLGEAKEITHIRTGRKVIDAIAEMGGGVTADEIIEYLQISRQAVSQQLILTEQEGNVIRRPGKRAGNSKGRPKDLWYLKTQLADDARINQVDHEGGGSPQKALIKLD